MKPRWTCALFSKSHSTSQGTLWSEAYPRKQGHNKTHFFIKNTCTTTWHPYGSEYPQLTTCTTLTCFGFLKNSKSEPPLTAIWCPIEEPCSWKFSSLKVHSFEHKSGVPFYIGHSGRFLLLSLSTEASRKTLPVLPPRGRPQKTKRYPPSRPRGDIPWEKRDGISSSLEVLLKMLFPFFLMGGSLSCVLPCQPQLHASLGSPLLSCPVCSLRAGPKGEAVDSSLLTMKTRAFWVALMFASKFQTFSRRLELFITLRSVISPLREASGLPVTDDIMYSSAVKGSLLKSQIAVFRKPEITFFLSCFFFFVTGSH